MAIDGRERVKNVTMDMFPGYRTLAKDCFPNAITTVDKFHVVKQLTPIMNRLRKEVTVDKR
jgi:transposase